MRRGRSRNRVRAGTPAWPTGSVSAGERRRAVRTEPRVHERRQADRAADEAIEAVRGTPWAAVHGGPAGAPTAADVATHAMGRASTGSPPPPFHRLDEDLVDVEVEGRAAGPAGRRAWPRRWRCRASASRRRRAGWPVPSRRPIGPGQVQCPTSACREPRSAQGVGLGGFAAVAGAAAASTGSRSSAHLAGFLQAERGRAQGMVAGERAGGWWPRGGCGRNRRGRRGGRSRGRQRAPAPAASRRRCRWRAPPGAQLAVAGAAGGCGGLQALDQLGFLQQRADLAGGLDPFDAAHLLERLSSRSLLWSAAKCDSAAACSCRCRAAKQRRVALAVDAGARPWSGGGSARRRRPLPRGAVALAVEQIHPRRVGQVGDLLGVEVGAGWGWPMSSRTMASM